MSTKKIQALRNNILIFLVEGKFRVLFESFNTLLEEYDELIFFILTSEGKQQ
jgi:hypothetical protein